MSMDVPECAGMWEGGLCTRRCAAHYVLTYVHSNASSLCVNMTIRV